MPRYSKKKKNGGFVQRKKGTMPSPRPRPAKKRKQWTRIQMEAAIRAMESGSCVSIKSSSKRTRNTTNYFERPAVWTCGGWHQARPPLVPH